MVKIFTSYLRFYTIMRRVQNFVACLKIQYIYCVSLLSCSEVSVLIVLSLCFHMGVRRTRELGWVRYAANDLKS